MRFIKGETLRDAIGRYHEGQADWTLRGLLMRFVAVCNTLAYAHSRGVIHRDLKPANIMLGKFGESLVVDWGMAKAVDGKGTDRLAEPALLPRLSENVETQTVAAMGTPVYMSPEQAAGRLDLLGPTSDIYSLGATLYTLLTGKAPFHAENVGEVLQRVRAGEFAPPRRIKADIPAPLQAICLKAMALNPEDRYASGILFAEDIEHWLADEPVSSYPEPWHARARRQARRHRTLVTSMLAALLVAALGVGVVLALQAAADRRQAAARQKEMEARISEAEGYERLGLLERERGHKEAALSWFLQARDKLAQVEVGDRAQRERLARISYNLATLFRETGKVERAGGAYQQAVAAYKALVDEDPENAESLSTAAH
jgi:serine/threonine-protein kinase